MDDFDKEFLEYARGRLAKIPGAFFAFEDEYISGRISAMTIAVMNYRSMGGASMAQVLQSFSGLPDAKIQSIYAIVDRWAGSWVKRFPPLEIEQLTKKNATKKPSLDNLDAGTGKKKPGRPVSDQALDTRIDELKKDAIREAKGIKKKELRTVDSVAKKLALQDKWPYSYSTIKPFLRASWWN